ncbi:histone-lysine N-methyltransferase SUV39H2-like [Penaeus japonicus]|uniref:histone-lysine N-methyltransferase SUV39H2-like n=1 Tax=Penaeus japonicus TaxID=27405 RepID=UPI001C70D07F|nr:histone-lysine N-methyltransferase SUV39H2-like [Penaeus japonicus]
MMSEAEKRRVVPSPEKKKKGYRAKVEAQEKLDDCFKELHEAFSRTKQAFISYKSKSFFFPDPDFIKKFTHYIKQVEGNLLDMGNVLSGWEKKNFDLEPHTAVKTASGIKTETESSENIGQTPQHNGNTVKDEATVSITPPASEAGNDEDLLGPGFETGRAMQKSESSKGRPLEKKRRHRNVEGPQSPKNAKRPRRSLIEDYLTVVDKDKDQKENGKEEAEEEEAEYEVETIVGFKKSEGQYFYNVSWRGYGQEDNTWEPSENLTSCEELLVEFYKLRLKHRDTLTSEEEFSSYPMPNDPSTKKLQREAIFAVMSDQVKQNLEKSLKILLSPKPVVPKMDIKINELADKVISTRKRERYDKLKQTLVEDVTLREVETKRKKQLAELRMWERKINSVCSDPAKLTVENNVDLELPAMNFIYINELRAGAGVTIPSDPVLGCECEDCFNNCKSCCPNQMNSWFAYNKYGRLKVSLGTPIYECNKRCKCNSHCLNRVVQKGRNVSLSIFRTANSCGWGVKALENIKKDTFVTEYVGEVITSEEAERRGKIYDAQGCTYLFDLDYDKGDQNLYTVDAAKYGNVSHFINHSCDPNLVVFNVWVNCLDPDLPRLALFSVRDIKKGEELTFDYNSGLGSQQMANGNQDQGKDPIEDAFGDVTTPQKSEGIRAVSTSPDMILKTPKGNRGLQYGKTECRCGAANCRKYFF